MDCFSKLSSVDLGGRAGDRIAILIEIGCVVVFGKRDGRRDAAVLNGFARGRVIFGYGENHCAAIIHLNGFAKAGIAVAAFAHNLRALVVEQSAAAISAPPAVARLVMTTSGPCQTSFAGVGSEILLFASSVLADK